MNLKKIRHSSGLSVHPNSCRIPSTSLQETNSLFIEKNGNNDFWRYLYDILTFVVTNFISVDEKPRVSPDFSKDCDHSLDH